MLFLSKSEKLRLKQEKMKQVEKNMHDFSAKLSEKMEAIKRLGAEAKLKGGEAQVKLLIKQFSVLETYKQKIEKMIISFKIAEEMRDIGMFTRDFFKNMSNMAREINRLDSDKELSAIVKSFGKDAENSEILVMDAEQKMQETQNVFSSMLDLQELSNPEAQNLSVDDERIMNMFDSYNNNENDLLQGLPKTSLDKFKNRL